MHSQAAWLLLLLVGCPSPDQEPGADNPWASPPSAAPPTTSPPSSPPPAVAEVAAETQPQPDAASEGAKPPSDGSCQPAAYAIESHPRGGPTVTLSGSVGGAAAEGTMLVELVEPAQRMSVYGVACPLTTTFSIAVPADLGEVVLAIFIDANGNGPDSTDVAGRHEERLQITDVDLSGLDVSVTASADLGDIPPPYSMPGGPSTDGVPSGSGDAEEPGGPSEDGVPPGPDADREPGTEPPAADGATPPQGAGGASEGSE